MIKGNNIWMGEPILIKIEPFFPFRGWDDIGYSFLVGQDGNVYEGRGWHHVGAHTQGYNSRGFAASFMGNFMTHLPNAASMNAVKALIACGVQKGYISPSYHLYGHRDVGSTECPGDQLYKEIQSWPHYSHTHPWTSSLFKLLFALFIVISLTNKINALRVFFLTNWCS